MTLLQNIVAAHRRLHQIRTRICRTAHTIAAYARRQSVGNRRQNIYTADLHRGQLDLNAPLKVTLGDPSSVLSPWKLRNGAVWLPIVVVMVAWWSLRSETVRNRGRPKKKSTESLLVLELPLLCLSLPAPLRMPLWITARHYSHVYPSCWVSANTRKRKVVII